MALDLKSSVRASVPWVQILHSAPYGGIRIMVITSDCGPDYECSIHSFHPIIKFIYRDSIVCVKEIALRYWEKFS